MPKYYGCPCEGCGKPLTLQDDIVVCPDCGEKHEIFGASHAAEAAQAHGIDTVCRIPMDSRLAANMDAGEIEEFEGDWLQPLVGKLAGLLKTDK